MKSAAKPKTENASQKTFRSMAPVYWFYATKPVPQFAAFWENKPNDRNVRAFYASKPGELGRFYGSKWRD